MKTALATVACAATATLSRASTQPEIAAPATSHGPFWLPELSYSFDALEPYIDAETMQIHHDVHHANYVANLNKVVTDPKIASWPIDRLLKNINAAPENVRDAIRNFGGGHYNHSVFWRSLKKNGGQPGPGLKDAIEQKFSSFSAFHDVFTKAALGQFGSGWTWLTSNGKDIRIEVTQNQDSPISQGWTPLVGIDLWEHAYYLTYQCKRADYIAAWFNVINWDYSRPSAFAFGKSFSPFPEWLKSQAAQVPRGEGNSFVTLPGRSPFGNSTPAAGGS